MSTPTEKPTPAGTDWTWGPTTLEDNPDFVDPNGVQPTAEPTTFIDVNEEEIDDDIIESMLEEITGEVEDVNAMIDDDALDSIIEEMEQEMISDGTFTPTFYPTAMETAIEIADDEPIITTAITTPTFAPTFFPTAIETTIDVVVADTIAPTVAPVLAVVSVATVTTSPTFDPTFFPTSMVTEGDEDIGVLPGKNNNNNNNAVATTGGSSTSTNNVSSNSLSNSNLTEDEIKYAAIGGSLAFVLLSFLFCCIYMKFFRTKSGKSAETDALNLNEQDNFHDEDNMVTTLGDGGGGGFKDNNSDDMDTELGAPTAAGRLSRNVL
jgi:hypothetical protein